MITQRLSYEDLESIPNTGITIPNEDMITDDRVEIDILKRLLDSLQQHMEVQEYRDVIGMLNGIQRDFERQIKSYQVKVIDAIFYITITELRKILGVWKLIWLLEYEVKCLDSGVKSNKTYSTKVRQLLTDMFSILTLENKQEFIKRLRDATDHFARRNGHEFLMKPDPWLIQQLKEYPKDGKDIDSVKEALRFYSNEDNPRFLAREDAAIRRALITRDWSEYKSRTWIGNRTRFTKWLY